MATLTANPTTAATPAGWTRHTDPRTGAPRFELRPTRDLTATVDYDPAADGGPWTWELTVTRSHGDYDLDGAACATPDAAARAALDAADNWMER
jgi:hypothetical protein